MTALGAIGEGLAELTLGARRRDAVLSFGGDAANICVMAARLGARARLAGRVGDDGLGERLITFWRCHGVDIGGVLRDPAAPTGLYVNEPVADKGHRFTYWRRGSAGSRLQPDDLQAGFFDHLAMLVITGVTLAVSRSSASAAEHAIERARAAGARVACVVNHRPALGGDLGQLAAFARASDIVIASREDTSAVFGTGDRDEVVARLAPGASEIVLTDGPAFASVTTGDETVHQPVPTVPARNAAGAGDALAGAYLAARLHGHPPGTSLAWGVAAAALSVRRDGCAASYPQAGETRALVSRLEQREAMITSRAARG